MSWTWHKLFLLSEFEETGLVSKSYQFSNSRLGEFDVLAVRGNLTSIVYDDAFLPINGLDGDTNAYTQVQDEDKGVYLGSDGYVYLGIEDD